MESSFLVASLRLLPQVWVDEFLQWRFLAVLYCLVHFASALVFPHRLPLFPWCSGDGWSGRAEDAVLHGCIPVVIMDDVHAVYESILDWDGFAVRINERR